MTDRRHGLAFIVALCTILAPSAQACNWQLKVGREPPQGAGIVCTPGQTEYQIATLNCENAPLHLDLEGACGQERAACSVRLAVDQTVFDLIGTNDPIGEIWEGVIEMPIAGRENLINALTTAQHIEVRVEGGPSWQLPIEGLADTLAVLAKSCRARTS